MTKCKVTFTNEDNQSIIIDFVLNEDGSLDYKPSFVPKLTDPKTDLGLAGQFVEIFIAALHSEDKSKDLNESATKEN